MDLRMATRHDRLYAITITLPPSHNRAIFDHNGWIRPIRRWLNMVSNHYCIYPELADLTGRLHYHGVILINDMIKFKHIKTSIDKNIGWVKIDKLKTYGDHLRWLMYCMKEWAGNSRMFKQPIMYARLRRAEPREIAPAKLEITDYFK